MLAITTGAILITSIDRVILPTVLPAILDEFNLNATEGGFLISLSFVGTAMGGVILGTLGDSLGRGPRRAWMWVVPVAVAVGASSATPPQMRPQGHSRGELAQVEVVKGFSSGTLALIHPQALLSRRIGAMRRSK